MTDHEFYSRHKTILSFLISFVAGVSFFVFSDSEEKYFLTKLSFSLGYILISMGYMLTYISYYRSDIRLKMAVRFMQYVISFTFIILLLLNLSMFYKK